MLLGVIFLLGVGTVFVYKLYYKETTY